MGVRSRLRVSGEVDASGWVLEALTCIAVVVMGMIALGWGWQ